MTAWTPDQEAELTRLYPTLSASEIARHLGRTKAAIKGRVNILGLRKPGEITNTGRFSPGQAPWNKGKPFDSGGRSHETRFKPGHLSGRAADLKQPIGAERISKDGYLQRKISDDPVFYKRWRFVHIMLWESAHGPVPKGHAVAFKNKERTDIRLENLECISRRELMLRNTVHNYPEELRQVMRLKGAISKRIATRIRKEQTA